MEGDPFAELAADIEAAMLLADNGRTWRMKGLRSDQWVHYLMVVVDPHTELGKAASRCGYMLRYLSDTIWLEARDGTWN